MTLIRLKRNEKMEVFTYGNHRQLDKCKNKEITIGEDVIKSAEVIKLLGIKLDKSLSFKEHKRTCRKWGLHLIPWNEGYMWFAYNPLWSGCCVMNTHIGVHTPTSKSAIKGGCTQEERMKGVYTQTIKTFFLGIVCNLHVTTYQRELLVGCTHFPWNCMFTSPPPDWCWVGDLVWKLKFFLS